MTPTKDTLEATTPETTDVGTAAAKADLNRLRADAVSLDIPVRVHGSRVTEVVRAMTGHTEPFEEEASTMIVFPHGGVLKMATVVGIGQMLVLTNLRTRQDAICRVVKVRAFSSSQAYVEVEFTHRQVGYWGVRFPADEDESVPIASSASAPPVAATAPAAEPEQKAAASPIVPPVAAPQAPKIEPATKLPAAPPKTSSVFAPIGSHEDVQPPAAHTEAKRNVAFGATAPRPAGTLANAAPAPPPAAARRASSYEPAEADSANITPHPARTFGTLTGGTARPAASVAAPDFGGRFDTSAPAARSGTWMWAGACTLILVGLAGGAFYFRTHPSSAAQPSATQPAPAAVASTPAPAAAQTVTQPPVATTTTPPTVNEPASQADTVVAAPAPALVNDVARPSRIDANTSEAQPRAGSSASNRAFKAATSPTPATTPKSFAPTDARPIARTIETNRVAAPSVTAAPATSAGLADVLETPEVPPAPTPAPPESQPLTRVRVGGVIVQPKLLRSVAPMYPSAARQAGIYGNVVIQANIDKAGNVGSMKVVSGPATLQSAAMTALRQWKYQPGTLDGNPIATEVTVTIRFQQQ